MKGLAPRLLRCVRSLEYHTIRLQGGGAAYSNYRITHKKYQMKSLGVGVLVVMGVANGLTPSSPSQRSLQSRRLVLSTLSSTAALTSLVVPSVARAAESSGDIKRKYQR